MPSGSEVDINGDGIVNILDIILVAQQMGKSTAAAPSAIAAMKNGELNPVMIQAWIEQAQIEDDGSIAFREGIAFLQSLLALLIPEETALLPNYPNPFNPETWIPYHLANPSEVTITLYDMRGTIVRQLNLGPQHEGYYRSRNPRRLLGWQKRCRRTRRQWHLFLPTAGGESIVFAADGYRKIVSNDHRITRMGGLQSQRQRTADPAADASHRCRESYHQHITRRPGFRR